MGVLMECSLCGGSVRWVGPLIALTHTMCSDCGAINSQIPECDPEEDEEEDVEE